MRNCAVCGKQFFPFTKSKIYCGSVCAQAAWREKNRLVTYVDCRGCGKTIEERPRGRLYCTKECRWKHRNSLRPTTQNETRKCLHCGTEFQPKQITGGGKRYCSKKCQRRVAYLNWKRRKDENIRCCVVCKNEMTGRSDKKYCSKACSSKAYRAAVKEDPERHEAQREYSRSKGKGRDRSEYNNREDVKARKAKWSRRKKLKIRRTPVAFGEYKEKRSHYQRVRKHRIRANGGTYSKDEWDSLVEKMNGVCPRCKQPTEKFTVDHIIPISKGGSNTIENIQPLCFSCNASKRHLETESYI